MRSFLSFFIFILSLNLYCQTLTFQVDSVTTDFPDNSIRLLFDDDLNVIAYLEPDSRKWLAKNLVFLNGKKSQVEHFNWYAFNTNTQQLATLETKSRNDNTALALSYQYNLIIRNTYGDTISNKENIKAIGVDSDLISLKNGKFIVAYKPTHLNDHVHLSCVSRYGDVLWQKVFSNNGTPFIKTIDKENKLLLSISSRVLDTIEQSFYFIDSRNGNILKNLDLNLNKHLSFSAGPENDSLLSLYNDRLLIEINIHSLQHSITNHTLFNMEGSEVIAGYDHKKNLFIKINYTDQVMYLSDTKANLLDTKSFDELTINENYRFPHNLKVLEQYIFHKRDFRAQEPFSYITRILIEY